MNGKAWKKVYQVREFEIRKRLSRNIIEDRAIEANDEILFVFVFDDVEVTHSIPKDQLLEIVCQPMIYHPDRKDVCKIENCTDIPHTMTKDTHHVDCSLCGNPRPYVEYKDWQTQEEMSKVCGGCMGDLVD